MYRFLAMQHVDFVPEGNTKPMQGYNVHFSDSEFKENAIGEIPFKDFFTYTRASALLNIEAPKDMQAFVEHIGKPCKLSFNRKGKITGISFCSVDSDDADVDLDTPF